MSATDTTNRRKVTVKPMRLIDVDELRKELGFAENCDKCGQKKRSCACDYCFSMMDFCNRFDIAVETVMERRRDGENDGKAD